MPPHDWLLIPLKLAAKPFITPHFLPHFNSPLLNFQISQGNRHFDTVEAARGAAEAAAHVANEAAALEATTAAAAADMGRVAAAFPPPESARREKALHFHEL